MHYRQFKLLNKSELQELSDRAERAVVEWCRQWCYDGCVDYKVSARAVEKESKSFTGTQSELTVIKTGEGRYVGLSWSADLPEKLYDSLLNRNRSFDIKSKPGTVITKKLLNHVMTSLVKKILEEVGFSEHCANASSQDIAYFHDELEKPASGYALLNIEVGDGAVLSVVVNCSDLFNSVGNDNTEEMVSTLNAFGSSKVTIQAMIGTVELNIQELTSLTVGDVISIDKKLNDKINLLIDGREFSQGYLGKMDNCFSVQVSD